MRFYHQLKAGDIPLNSMEASNLQALIKEKFAEETFDVDQFILFAQLLEMNEQLKESVDRKELAMKELFMKISEDKRNLTKNVLESQLQLLYSFVVGTQIFDLYDLPPQVKEYFEAFIRNTEDQLAKIQATTMELYPISMDDLGVLPSLQSYYDYIREHKSSNIQVTIEGQLPRYRSDLEIILFRCAQQLIKTLNDQSIVSQLTLTFSEMEENKIHCHFYGKGLKKGILLEKDYLIFTEILNSISEYVNVDIEDEFFNICIIINTEPYQIQS